jgi:hypothetical protein
VKVTALLVGEETPEAGDQLNEEPAIFVTVSVVPLTDGLLLQVMLGEVLLITITGAF